MGLFGCLIVLGLWGLAVFRLWFGFRFDALGGFGGFALFDLFAGWLWVDVV